MQSKLFAFLKWVKNASQWTNKGGRLARPLQPLRTSGGQMEIFILTSKPPMNLENCQFTPFTVSSSDGENTLAIIHYNCTEKENLIIN